MTENARAEAHFKELLDGGESAIDALWQQQEPETEWLDFKSGEAAHLERWKEKGPQGGGKFIWSECLSAFANTGGGVVVWGIETESISTAEGRKLDRAVKKVAVPEPSAFAEKLRKSSLNLIQIPLSGVDAKEVGPYVVSLIPNGPQKPYRSIADQRYYMRANDSSIPIPHEFLRSLFHQRLLPTFHLRLSFEKSDDHSVGTLVLKNIGYATAEDLLIRMTIGPSITFNASVEQLPTRSEFIHLRPRLDMHPHEPPITLGKITVPHRDNSIRLEFFCRDQQPQAIEIEWKKVKILAGGDWRYTAEIIEPEAPAIDPTE